MITFKPSINSGHYNVLRWETREEAELIINIITISGLTNKLSRIEHSHTVYDVANHIQTATGLWYGGDWNQKELELVYKLATQGSEALSVDAIGS